jgi:hypothetical protein
MTCPHVGMFSYHFPFLFFEMARRVTAGLYSPV